MHPPNLQAITYRGICRRLDNLVFVHPEGLDADGAALDPRLDLREHSPTGLTWGYGGSGPAQLALALTSDFFRRLGVESAWADKAALSFYQAYKFHVIARLSENAGWTRSALEVAQDFCAMATADPDGFSFALRRLADHIADREFERYHLALEALEQAAEKGAPQSENLPTQPSEAAIRAEARAVAAACFPTMAPATLDSFLQEPQRS